MKYIQSLGNLQAYQSVRQTSLAISGGLCTVGGLVADVLQPLAPFVFYLFVLSGIATLVLGVLYVRGTKALLGALLLSAMALAVTGLFTVMQQGEGPEERGVVASSFPAIASLQDSLGIIEQKLDDIKEDTQDIKDSTARLEAQSDEMLAAIKNGFGSSDGIIANPSSPEQHYHNARVHELAGDYMGARRSYLEYFKSDSVALDPHLRFISFLKVQEGTAGARETYNELTAGSDNPTVAYARLLLLGKVQRIAGLTKYFADNPAFAPVAYHLSIEYSERRLGSQTMGDKREELSYLKAFESRDESGGLLRYFIDQALVAQWRGDAQERLVMLENGASAGALENPVSLSWMAHNAGWNGNVQIAEPALDIKWRIKGKGTPKSTGKGANNDPNTGQLAPRMFFQLPKSQPNSTIEVWYTDLQGVERGPYEFKFVAKAQSNDSNRRMLEMTSTSWVALQDNGGSTLLYFTHLLTYRGALTKIEYGLNRATPNKRFKFPAWRKSGVAPVDASMTMYVKVPKSTRYVTVRLSYKDGGKSDIVRFER